MTTPPLRRSTASLKAVDLPAGFAAVEDMMRVLVKAVRAQQLYLPNNPMYRTAIDGLRAGFAAIWRDSNELVLAIEETEIKWSGVAVLGEASKSSDNLAWLFYKDGVRELRFAKGVEDTEIIRFLEIVTRARKATLDNDDLITMLWEADLAGLTYKYMDLQTEGGEASTDDSEDGDEDASFQMKQAESEPAPPAVIVAGTEQASREAKASGVVNMADFDATLHFLDEKESAYLRQEIEREYSQDLRTSIISALLDIFEQQDADGVREEVLDHVETMLAFMLASASFHGVAYLLRETAIAASRANNLSPALGARISTLTERLSAPEALDQLIEALDAAPTLPPREELAAIFNELRPVALGTMFSWLLRARADGLRALVAEVADRLASGNPAEIVKLIDSGDAGISNEAVRRAGALKTQAAVTSLTRIIAEPDPKRRLLGAQALADIGSTGALQALERCVSDTARDIRIIAARSLAARGHRPALARLEPIIRGKEIRDADITEKTAFFESYGAVCGDGGVTFLDGILNGKGLLGRRDDPEMRAAAAAGLGRIGSAKANESLQRATVDKDVVVRGAVARALRGTAP